MSKKIRSAKRKGKKGERPEGSKAPTDDEIDIFATCATGFESAKKRFSEIQIRGATSPEDRDACVEIAIDRLFFIALKRLTEHVQSKNENVSVRACGKVADLRIAILRGRTAKLKVSLEKEKEELEGEFDGDGWSF